MPDRRHLLKGLALTGAGLTLGACPWLEQTPCRML
ncbi:twin-arginine translocation signal domain-containing protein [Salinimonas marina]|uniref:Twin-arginine translocation signal domain-containing protein n=1 Tax=Salinimonas marina TaxID=2785918 RepID=A0A7S9HD86_9ALTE|nr:twin-arginine translocation signal domain-containing protein [Salinimonas marina]QPG05869.1 twin-arginine translocation signal domain-containing protein [Salinimonas marina]